MPNLRRTVVGLDDNRIDLVDIKSDLHGVTVLPTVTFDSATDVLAITSNVDPTEVAHIQLQGDYTGVTWGVTTDGKGGTDITEVPGVITGLVNGNASEGSPIKASITDGGAAVTTATYTWQISENGVWVPGPVSQTSTVITPRARRIRDTPSKSRSRMSTRSIIARPRSYRLEPSAAPPMFRWCRRRMRSRPPRMSRPRSPGCRYRPPTAVLTMPIRSPPRFMSSTARLRSAARVQRHGQR